MLNCINYKVKQFQGGYEEKLEFTVLKTDEKEEMKTTFNSLFPKFTLGRVSVQGVMFP